MMMDYLLRGGDPYKATRYMLDVRIVGATGLNAKMLSKAGQLNTHELSSFQAAGVEVYEMLSDPWSWEQGPGWSWDKDTKRVA